MSFCTAINCMDGRTQSLVIAYLQWHFGVDYVDMITAAGPVARLAEDPNGQETESLLKRVDISINAHDSHGLAIAGHYDCAGNPVADEVQKSQLRAARGYLQALYPGFEVLALWIGPDWIVVELDGEPQEDG